MGIIVTVTDVANKAGVSKTTVSRVLNNSELVNVNTANKVYKAMEELNYVPNDLAKSLFKKKSNVIALIVPTVSHNFFAGLTDQIEEYIWKKGYKLMLCNTRYTDGKEIEYLELLKRQIVDGIIITSHTAGIEDYVKMLELPIVSFDRKLSYEIPCISSDNYMGGKMATEYLIHKGCKSILFLGSFKKINLSAQTRYNAFIDVAKENNIEYFVGHIKYTKFAYKDMLKQLDTIIRQYKEVDGIFASSDEIGIAAMKVAQSLGKSIPEQMQIIGYDNTLLSEISRPELTTINQPIEKIAKTLCDVLINKIENNEQSYKKEYSKMPVELIIRGTTRI